MPATASAIRQTRQQELGAGDIEEGLYLHFIQDTRMCIRTRGIHVPVFTSFTVIFLFIYFFFVAMGTFVSKQAQSRETVGRKTHLQESLRWIHQSGKLLHEEPNGRTTWRNKTLSFEGTF